MISYFQCILTHFIFIFTHEYEMIFSFQVAALVPKSELDQLGVITNQDVHSRMMTQALRKIHYTLSRSQTLIIFVNQVKTTLLKIVFLII